MAKRTTIDISEEILTELQTVARSAKAERRQVERAKIILQWHEGKSYVETRESLGVTEGAINKWRRRFAEKGMEGLVDAPRSGKPPVFTAAQKANVIKLATRKPPQGYTSWSQHLIAKEAGMSQSKVNQILSEADLKPHKVEYWCGKSTGPEFESKMINIVGLYMNPPENALVLIVDEKTRIQALDRTKPILPLKEKAPKRLTATSKRNGTVALIAALAVHKGDITAKTVDKNNAESFLGFLEALYRKYPKKHLQIIADNLTVHKHKSVTEWINSRKRITMHFTPTYSSLLNQIEIWFSILTRDVLRGGVWKSKKHLVDQLMNLCGRVQ